jgi:hypothetical protein
MLQTTLHILDKINDTEQPVRMDAMHMHSYMVAYH